MGTNLEVLSAAAAPLHCSRRQRAVGDMVAEPAQPLMRRPPFKVLHLVRHGEGLHNVEAAEKKKEDGLLSWDLLDAELSSRGLQQVADKRKEVLASELFKKIELIVTSPMTRAMQTAVGIFGERHCREESDAQTATALATSEANDGHYRNSAASASNRPSIVAMELCRERMGRLPCDRRRSVRSYQSQFPEVDFQLIKTDNDELWQAKEREELDDVAKRGMEFLKWLWMRQEKEIVVVSHGIFLQQLLRAFGEPVINSDLQNKRFDNCEIRSIIIPNRGRNGLSSMKANSCNKIPHELSLSSSALKDTHLQQKSPSFTRYCIHMT